MQILNIILLVIDLPLVVLSGIVCGKGPKGHTARQVSGVAAVYGFLLVATCGVEWLISLTSGYGVAYDGIELLRIAVCVPLACCAVCSVAASAVRDKKTAVFAVCCGLTAVLCGAITVYMYNRLYVYGQFFSFAAIILLLYIPYAVFWLGNMLLIPEGKVQNTLLTVTQVIFAATIAVMLTYAFDILMGTVELSQVDAIAIILTVLLVAVIAWPLFVSGGTVLADKLRAATVGQRKK